MTDMRLQRLVSKTGRKGRKRGSPFLAGKRAKKDGKSEKKANDFGWDWETYAAEKEGKMKKWRLQAVPRSKSVGGNRKVGRFF